MKQALKNFAILLLFFLVAAGLISSFSNSYRGERQAPISELVQRLTAKEITSIVVTENRIHAKLTSGETIQSLKEPQETFGEVISSYGVPDEALQNVSIDVREPSGLVSFLTSSFLPFILPLLVIGFIVFIMFRQIQGVNQRAMSFGQSGAREMKPDEKNRVTFADVAGVREAKQELTEVVEFLRFPKKFAQVGAKIPKGVMLVGSPGTGKTLLARAVAGEANVPFFHVSGSEFVEMFVGVGASRVRSLFARAKKSAPCIIFIDELDAVGRQRGTGLGGSHDEREQTLNQILVEMDGFEPNSGVVVIAATNRPDVLDQALLRPGRFDRRVILDEPDIRDREEILMIHAKGKPLGKDVDLKTIAQRTSGFSGADLANLLNEAAILTARRNKKEVGNMEVLESIEKVILGPERKSHVLTEREKTVTAYHEAGHAIVAHFQPQADPVHKVSIISRGRAGGYTMKVPSEDKHMHTKEEFISDIAVMLAGLATEREVFGELTTGASSDLKQATGLARRMVMVFGMSDKLGPRMFGDHEGLTFLGKEITEQRTYSEKTAETIDAEIDVVIRESLARAEKIIRHHRDDLERVTHALIEHETLERNEFESIVGPKVSDPTIESGLKHQEKPRKSSQPIHDS